MKTSKNSGLVRFILFSSIGLVLFLSFACKKSAPKDSASEPALSPKAARQQRLEWNLTTLVKAYEQAGHTNPKWDEAAKSALTEFARSRSGIPDAQSGVISSNVASAIQAGCDDPMVNYLFIRYAMSPTNSKEAFTDAFLKTAQEMETSSYPKIRKFYAGFRAIEQYAWANNYPTNSPTEVNELRGKMVNNLQVLLDDTRIPPGEIYDVSHEFLETWKGSKEAYTAYWTCMEPSIFKNWPDEETSWLLKGEAYVEEAWLARGGGYANTVTPTGWMFFSNNLLVAEQALNRAWKLNPNDPRIAVKMMRVELGQGQGRDRMESWFRRAMELNPNEYDACSIKCLYLEPKWYGSIEEMLSFGRECVQNKDWGGKVPLILVDAHSDIPTYYLNGAEKTNYWKQPDVWLDTKAAYDRFFELNPNATDIYKNYAWHAYHAEQWNAFIELAPKVRPQDHNFFGGEDEFNKMLQLAKENTGNPK